MILGARDILCVEFQPTDARKYALDVSLRVDMNPRIRWEINFFYFILSIYYFMFI